MPSQERVDFGKMAADAMNYKETSVPPEWLTIAKHAFKLSELRGRAAGRIEGLREGAKLVYEYGIDLGTGANAQGCFIAHDQIVRRAEELERSAK